MKKILTLNKGAAGQWYDGIRCQRIEQAGRLELLRVLNDGLPYWLVMIRNFNQSVTGSDRIALQGRTTPWGNGVWRYLEERPARETFEQLSRLPIFVAEHARSLEIRNKKRERIQTGALASYAFQKRIYPQKVEGV
jgi:hypothetical protein